MNGMCIRIYTDGACYGNPGPGGWGFVFIDDFGEVIKSLYGYEVLTTNNRMELTAVVEGLKCLENQNFYAKVEVFTDSKYVKDGITSWIKKWKVNGWRTSNNSAVKNQDLWQELDLFSDAVSPSWHWVKAHGTDSYNNMVDLLAKKGAEEASNASLLAK